MLRGLLVFLWWLLFGIKSLGCSVLCLLRHFPGFNSKQVYFSFTMIWLSRSSDSDWTDVFSFVRPTLQWLQFLVDVELGILDNRESSFDRFIPFLIAFLWHHRFYNLRLLSEWVVCSGWATRLHHAPHRLLLIGFFKNYMAAMSQPSFM